MGAARANSQPLAAHPLTEPARRRPPRTNRAITVRNVANPYRQLDLDAALATLSLARGDQPRAHQQACALRTQAARLNASRLLQYAELVIDQSRRKEEP